MLGAAETDLWDEAVLRTAARAFRAWRHAVAQAHEPRRSSAATVLGSERYRQLGLRRRSLRSLRGSQSEERPPDEPAATTTSEQREIPEELEQPLPSVHLEMGEAQEQLGRAPEFSMPVQEPLEGDTFGEEHPTTDNPIQENQDSGAVQRESESPNPMQEIGPSNSSAVQATEWSDSPITEAEEAELSESRTEERKIHGEMTSLQSEHLSDRQDKERRREGAEGAEGPEGAEGAGREEKERREGGGPERKQFKGRSDRHTATMSTDQTWYVLGDDEPPSRSSEGALLLAETRLRQSSRRLMALCLTAWSEGIGFAISSSIWEDDEEDMQRWHLRGLELRFQENEELRLKEQEERATTEAAWKENVEEEMRSIKERLQNDFQEELRSQALEAERQRQILEAGFLQRLAGAERERDNLQAQVDYAVYDARREKDLMEARLRGELDDAQHQQEIQQAKAFALAQDAERMREIDQAHVDNRVLDIQREKDLMEARLRGELDDAQHQRQFQEARHAAALQDELRHREAEEAKMQDGMRRQEAAAEQSRAALEEQLQQEHAARQAEQQEHQRRIAEMEQQVAAAQDEGERERARAFDLQAAIENLMTAQEIRGAEERWRIQQEENREALLHLLDEVETQRARLQAEVNELQASYVSLEAEADAERSKNQIAEQTLQERDIRVADLIKDIQKYRSEHRALKDQALELGEQLSELEKERDLREAELMADIQKLQSENDALNDEAFELAEQLTELGKERWLLSLDARLEEEQRKASELEDQLLEERLRCAQRLEDMSEQMLEEKAKSLDLRTPGPGQEAKYVAQLEEAKNQVSIYERGWRQAFLEAQDLETLLKKEREQRQHVSDLLEDLERRCFNVQKDLSLQHLPEVFAREREQMAQMAQKTTYFEDHCEKLQKSVADLQAQNHQLSLDHADEDEAVARRFAELREQYEEVCSYAESVDHQLHDSKQTLSLLDGRHVVLEQRLARQKAVLVDLLTGRSKVQLMGTVLRCFLAWCQWLVEAKTKKRKEVQAARMRTKLDDEANHAQGRALRAFHMTKNRAVNLRKVADILLEYQVKMTKVHLFLSWRLCKEQQTAPSETAPAEAETETFSKAWYDHKEELQRQREQVIEQMLDTDAQESAIMDQAIAQAERVAESVAEKMYRQLCMELVKETFNSWRSWYQEKKRSQAEKEAEAARAHSVQTQQAAEPAAPEALSPPSAEDDAERRRRQKEREEQEAFREEMWRQRDAAEREALQRQQQLAAAEREALVEQIKAARMQQSFEMEMLKEQVARAEDARRSQQEELERLKQEVTKGSVYQEIIQQFRSTPSGYPSAGPAPQGIGDVQIVQQVEQAAPLEVVSTQTAGVTTRSISVEAVPEMPRIPQSQRPNPRALELGRNQAEMLERMLIKAVLQGWQTVVLGWRPFESRVRDVPWQTPPEDPLLPRPRGQNLAFSAEMAVQGLNKWSAEPVEGDLTTADMYEAAARAHATFASWAVSSSRRHMSANQIELSPEEEAGEQAVLRATENISAQVMEELEQFAMQPTSSWPPPLLPPRPVLPGDSGWDERVRHVAEPRRRLFGTEEETVEEVLVVQSDGYLTSFHALPSADAGQSTSEPLEAENG